ncbi:MAG: adenosylcobinamide-GDP ribazoletransferase [Magnetococcus sp. DMHC-6]
MLNALYLALSLLTRIPTPPQTDATAQELGRSVLCYPLVGAILGAILCALAQQGPIFSDSLTAALVLAAWVFLTGGLHLDGLADSADAWVGGLGDRVRTLEIMKDPHCGPSAVSVVVVLLLLKYSAIETILSQQNELLLIWPAVFGRLGIVVLFLVLPYARPHGMGKIQHAHLSRRWGWGVVFLTFIALIFCFGVSAFFFGVPWVVAIFLFYRTMLDRTGGITGDLSGAVCEILEAVALIVLAWMGHEYPI